MARDPAALARLAASEVAARAEAAVASRGRFTVALAGGTTPARLHALLADPGEPFRARIAWERTQVFFGDERHVGPDHPDSNYGAARATLLGRVPLPPGAVHRVRGEVPDAAAAAGEYERELRQVLAPEPGAPPRLDVILLGMGGDGHTASLFPGSEALDERVRLVVAPWVARLGAHRITLTLPVLDAARTVLFLVAGPEKAPRLAEVLEGPASELPAARVRPRDGELLWLLDEAAAALLRGPVERS